MGIYYIYTSIMFLSNILFLIFSSEQFCPRTQPWQPFYLRNACLKVGKQERFLL